MTLRIRTENLPSDVQKIGDRIINTIISKQSAIAISSAHVSRVFPPESRDSYVTHIEGFTNVSANVKTYRRTIPPPVGLGTIDYPDSFRKRSRISVGMIEFWLLFSDVPGNVGKFPQPITYSGCLNRIFKDSYKSRLSKDELSQLF